MIPVYKPSLNGNEQKYVAECLNSSWISSKGTFISRFEKNFASYIGIKHSVTVSNGTVAIHLALLALGICPGDEVIVPTLTYIASVNPIVYCGATPVFVDSESDTWQISISDVERKISSKTKAIIAVHLYGHPCEMEKLVQIAKKYGIFLIEDCAEAFGSRYEKKYVGTFGDISTFSFFGNKTITTGEGGMVVTDDETLNERLLQLKGQGLAKHREYWHDIVGYNYRMTNICAAIGLAQLENADKIIRRKREIANLYMKLLKKHVVFQVELENCFHTYWMVTILVQNQQIRDDLRKYLLEREIETRPTFYPVHTMPMYSTKYQKFKNSEDIGWRGINLPSYPDLSDAEIIKISNFIKGFYE